MRKNKKQRYKEFFEKHGIPLPNEEGVLQVECEDYLKELKKDNLLDYLHLNSGGGKAGKRQKVGEADLIIFGKHSNTFFVELKSKIGKERDTQIKNFALKRLLGYTVYSCIKNIEEFKTIIKTEIINE